MHSSDASGELLPWTFIHTGLFISIRPGKIKLLIVNSEDISNVMNAIISAFLLLTDFHQEFIY